MSATVTTYTSQYHLPDVGIENVANDGLEELPVTNFKLPSVRVFEYYSSLFTAGKLFSGWSETTSEAT